MTKAELIEAVAEQANTSKADAERTVDAFFDVVVSRAKAGDKVAWPGFGSFSTTCRAARTDATPDGCAVNVKASTGEVQRELRAEGRAEQVAPDRQTEDTVVTARRHRPRRRRRRRAPAKKTAAAKKAPAKKAPAKTVARKAPDKRTVAKKAPAKKAVASGRRPRRHRRSARRPRRRWPRRLSPRRRPPGGWPGRLRPRRPEPLQPQHRGAPLPGRTTSRELRLPAGARARMVARLGGPVAPAMGGGHRSLMRLNSSAAWPARRPLSANRSRTRWRKASSWPSSRAFIVD